MDRTGRTAAQPGEAVTASSATAIRPGARRRVKAWFHRGPETGPPQPSLPAGAIIDSGLELPADDPLAGYLMQTAHAVDIRKLGFDSPALGRLREAGVVLVVPLISAGTLTGALSLGPRLSEREYSTEDRQLLNALTGHAAPAIRVGQLIRQQQDEARQRERIEQELKVAQLIQQRFLPKSLPDLPGWQLAAYYRPALTVGGDFYDFIPLPGGQLMIVIGDVADKGVPAALVMASTHALLRGTGPRLTSPGAVLADVNEFLCADLPARMFVTCLALVLDAAGGRVTFANAGHDVPYVRTDGGVAELRARGMPLGLMPGMSYEEKTFTFEPGDCALLYSDGLAEAHAADREMFGFHRTAAVVGKGSSGDALIQSCLAELDAFAGPAYEQEDDITLVSLERTTAAVRSGGGAMTPPRPAPRRLASFTLASKQGNEQIALAQVADSVAGLGLSPARLDKLKTAVAETTMNAIEHGNGGRSDLPVDVEVFQSDAEIVVAITDRGGRAEGQRPEDSAEVPDLDRKLDGQQGPRGWGLFLIRHMVDGLDLVTEGERHTVRLIMRAGSRRGAGSQP